MKQMFGFFLPNSLCLVYMALLFVKGGAEADAARGGSGRSRQPGSPPIITEHPEDDYFAKNEPETLNCKATGNPPPKITWYRNGNLVETNRDNPQSHRMLLDNGQLFFLRVIHSKNNRPDVGVYYCNATNVYGTALSREATIKIAVLKDDFRQEPTDTVTAVGKTAVLHCRPPKGEPEPKVIWRKMGTPVQTSDRIELEEDGDLVIRSIQKSDAGEYLCVATNKGGDKQSKPAQIRVLDLPNFRKLPKDVEAHAGKTANFTCDVSGDPPLNIQWTKEDGIISFNRSRILPDKTLQIVKVEAKDEGIYVCSAENSAGSTKATARLSVLTPPTFLIRPRDQEVAKGRTITLHCVVTGKPPPTLFWRKVSQGKMMFPTRDKGHYTVLEDGIFRIENVTEDDADEYICEALNLLGQASTSATVRVIEQDTRPPPIIYIGPHNQTLPVKTLALLQCQAKGPPDPVIRWYKDGHSVDMQDTRVTQLGSGTLQISDLQETDTGVYTCKAFSESGETTWDAFLDVQSDTDQPFHQTPGASALPDPPSKPLVRDITDTTVHLAWQPGRNPGSSPVYAFHVEYFGLGATDGWVTASSSVQTESYTVQGLHGNTTYLFLIRAKNTHGVGLPSALSDPVQTLAQRKQNSSDVKTQLRGKVVEMVKAQAVNASAITVSWKVLKGQSLLEGFYVQYKVIVDIRRIRYGKSYSRRIGPELTSYTVTGLAGYQWYEICVLGYSGTVQTQCSSPVKVQTEEAGALQAPSDIQVNRRSDTEVVVQWAPPTVVSTNRNWRLTAYQLECYSENKGHNCSQTINSDKTRFVVKHMLPNQKYFIRMAAQTSQGPGEWSKMYIIDGKVYMSDIPLVDGSEIDNEDDSDSDTDQAEEVTLMKEPWFIGVLIGTVGGSLWLILCVLTIWLCRRRKTRKMKQQRFYTGVPIRKVDESNRTMCYPAYGTKDRNIHCQNDLDLPPEFTALLQGKKEAEINEDNLYKTAGNCSFPELKTFYQKADPVAPYATTTLIQQQQNMMKQRGLEHMFRPINQGYIQHSEGSGDSCQKPDPSTDSNTDNSRPNTGVYGYQCMHSQKAPSGIHLENSCDAMQSPTSDSGSHTTDENGLLIKQRKKNNNLKNLFPSKHPMLNWADMLPPPPEHPPPSEMGDNPPDYSEVRGDNPVRTGSPMSPVSFSQLSACSCPVPHTQTPVSGWNMPVYSDNECPRCHSERYYDPGAYCHNPYVQRTQSPRTQMVQHSSNRSIPYSYSSAPRGNTSVTCQYSTPQRGPASSTGPVRTPSNRGSHSDQESQLPYLQGYKIKPHGEQQDYKFLSESEWGPGPAPPCRHFEQDAGSCREEQDGDVSRDQGCQSSLPNLANECINNSLYSKRPSRGDNQHQSRDSPVSEGADYAADSDLEQARDLDWSVGGQECTDASSVQSSTGSSGDGAFLTEADFASAVARAAEMSGLTVVGTTVCDLNPKSKKERRHRRPARPISPGYSTDSNYGSIDIVHRPYPKSQRKKQLQEQGKIRGGIKETNLKDQGSEIDSNSSSKNNNSGTKDNNSSSGVYDMPYSRPQFPQQSSPASPAIPVRFSSLNKKIMSPKCPPEGSTPAYIMGENSAQSQLSSPREDIV